MNLPDAPIAHEGFFATHFFTVRDQEKSKDFYVRILGKPWRAQTLRFKLRLRRQRMPTSSAR